MVDLRIKLDNIDSLKRELDSLKPFSADIEKRLKDFFDNAIIYNSTLGKNYNPEYLNIFKPAHKEAIDYIEELSKNNNRELCGDDIIKIHFILFKNIYPNFAGKYKANMDNNETWVSLKNGEKATVCPPFINSK